MRHAILAASILFTACATSPSDDGIRPDDQQIDSHPDGKADGGESCTFSGLQGLYDHFGYKPFEDGHFVDYRIGMSWGSHLALANGDETDITLYLLPENRAIIDYTEQTRVDSSSVQVKAHAIVVTTVSQTTDGSIELAGLGTATPTEFSQNDRCAPALELEYAHDIMQPGLAGQSSTIVTGLSTGWVVDPDHLDQIPNTDGREYYTQAIADGTIKVIHLN